MLILKLYLFTVSLVTHIPRICWLGESLPWNRRENRSSWNDTRNQPSLIEWARCSHRSKYKIQWWSAGLSPYLMGMSGLTPFFSTQPPPRAVQWTSGGEGRQTNGPQLVRVIKVISVRNQPGAVRPGPSLTTQRSFVLFFSLVVIIQKDKCWLRCVEKNHEKKRKAEILVFQADGVAQEHCGVGGEWWMNSLNFKKLYLVK